ncbi:MAG: hypothetical protein IKI62_07125 [Clostridia bacterium]|nr:hypothetical protein [Clostridia bacterium]
MRRIISLLLTILFIFTVLPGCSSRKDAPESSPSVIPSESEDIIGKDKALEGIRNYCMITYGKSDAIDGINLEDDGDKEYILKYRSFTGAIVTFHVDRLTGNVKVTEYMPALGIESEAEPFLISDYIGIDIPEGPEDDPNDWNSHYVFRPKVCSSYMEEVFGTTMRDAWFSLVDAVMAGEDTFSCPDQYTYDWVMGQFPEQCFPVLTEIIDYAYDRENSVKDGIASFTYKMNREEAALRIDEFQKQIEGILNNALEDDYSDLEKVLALYEYFAYNYSYDFESYEKSKDVCVPDICTIRFFNLDMGICSEISSAYSYLLMQAGVDATVMSGTRSYDLEPHQWSYVRINGHDYHIDPTYVISDKTSLSYFMMTDEQREACDSYSIESFYITSHYSREHEHPEHMADDDTFGVLWGTEFDSFDHDRKKIIYYTFDDNGDPVQNEFSYMGY